MSRAAQPWFRTQTQCWYVQLNGQKHNLGKHPDSAPPPVKLKKQWRPPPEIELAFRKLQTGKLEKVVEEQQALLVMHVCSAYLNSICPYESVPAKKPDRKKGEKPPPVKPDTPHTEKSYWWYRDYLEDFCRHVYKDHKVGTFKAADLIPHHVSSWLKAHPTWTTGKGCAVRAIKRAFNWADQEGILRPNPIKHIKRDPVPCRGRVLTRDERKEILDAIDDVEFRLFVEAMQESGCRPSEVARVSSENVKLDIGIWEFKVHKTGKKTKRPRVVYLTPRLLEITKELLAKYPTGPLFRGPRQKKPFGMHGICSRFRRLRIKLPHLKDAIAYAYRASFATDALQNDVGVAQVAELLGHSSTDQVMRHYSAIRERTEYMREVAAKATRG